MVNSQPNATCIPVWPQTRLKHPITTKIITFGSFRLGTCITHLDYAMIVIELPVQWVMLGYFDYNFHGYLYTCLTIYVSRCLKKCAHVSVALFCCCYIALVSCASGMTHSSMWRCLCDNWVNSSGVFTTTRAQCWSRLLKQKHQEVSAKSTTILPNPEYLSCLAAINSVYFHHITRN